MGGRIIAIGVFTAAWAALLGVGCVTTVEVEGVGSGSELQAPRACGDHPLCEEDQYCFQAMGTCSDSPGGACHPKPEECPYLQDPVCGCDGVTYSNACFAAMMGTSVQFQGTCEAVVSRRQSEAEQP